MGDFRPLNGYNSNMLARNLTPRVQSLLKRMPVVFLQGARQVGKTTLAKQLIAEGVMERYLSFDDPVALSAARQDPAGFTQALNVRTVIDEVQRAPEILPLLKMRVDDHREPGMFLLTGSADPFALPQVSETLVGRMAVATMMPLSQGEIEGVQENWLDTLFNGHSPLQLRAPANPLPLKDLFERVSRGGFPEAVLSQDDSSRAEWLSAYIETLLARDARDLVDIERRTELPRLLHLLAAHTCQTLNIASLSRDTGIPQTTLQRYLTLFETLFIVTRAPAWYANLGKRLLKSPKWLLCDTGLASVLLGSDTERLRHDPILAGRLVENFVGMELLKQIGFTGRRIRLYHLRSDKGMEVDFVLEDEQGRLAGVEVKAGATVGSNDFRGLRALRDLLKDRFVGGVALYAGEHTLPFGEGIWAQPLSALWSA